jgi:mRNA-degrading endonuclease RelE of RelBE toxin-antitoxin system
MNYEFKITPDFARDFKRLLKQHKHLAADFDRFLMSFVHTLGDIIPGTGGAYKIRMSATGTGKRGGYRLIYYFFHENEIYFLKIYHKAIQENISESERKQIQQLIHKIRSMN